MSFENREAVKLWMLKNQIARRNLNTFQRIEATLQFEEIFAAKAKANQVASGGAVPQIFVKPTDTNKELAKLANTSYETVRKVKKIIKKASPKEIIALRREEHSINSVYQKYFGKKEGTESAPEAEENPDRASMLDQSSGEIPEQNRPKPQDEAKRVASIETAGVVLGEPQNPGTLAKIRTADEFILMALGGVSNAERLSKNFREVQNGIAVMDQVPEVMNNLFDMANTLPRKEELCQLVEKFFGITTKVAKKFEEIRKKITE